jgi:hypothetical protein
MVLTNAERQERYRQRLKARANSPGAMLQAARLEWLAEARKDFLAEANGNADDPDVKRLDILWRKIESEPATDESFRHIVGSDMGRRLQSVRLPRGKVPTDADAPAGR